MRREPGSLLLAAIKGKHRKITKRAATASLCRVPHLYVAFAYPSPVLQNQCKLLSHEWGPKVVEVVERL
jgi:hypothetical protein